MVTPGKSNSCAWPAIFRRCAALALLAAGIFLAVRGIAPHLRPESKSGSTSVFSLSAPENSAAAEAPATHLRPLYPFSVIPGGVENRRELKNAIANDPVVAKHYEGFDVRKAKIISLDRDRIVYVSYRMGNDVFWTKRPIKLHKGEMVITDGKNEARTRCGNRISQSPQASTSAKEPLDALDGFPKAPILNVSTLPVGTSLTPPPAFPVQAEREHDGFAPPFLPIWGAPGFLPSPRANTPSSPVVPDGPIPPPPPGPPAVPAPEPSNLLLLSAGLSILLVWRTFRKRARIL